VIPKSNYEEKTGYFAGDSSVPNIPDPDQIVRKVDHESSQIGGGGYAGKKVKRSEGYKPYTLEEYNSKVRNQNYKYGGLGANTHTDDWKEKKGNALKVNAFSEVIKEANAHKISSAPQSKRPEPAKKPSTREKALEFAKNIPKPKATPHNKEPQIPTNNYRPPPAPASKTVEDKELELLEKKHEYFLQKLNKKESHSNS
jgi:hypothetical protein